MSDDKHFEHYKELMERHLAHYKELKERHQAQSNYYQGQLYHALKCNRQQSKGLQRQARKIRRLQKEVGNLPKQVPIIPPRNNINATHWAVCKDGQILYYRIGDEVYLWFAHSKVWDKPGSVPYTLNSFDDRD